MSLFAIRNNVKSKRTNVDFSELLDKDLKIGTKVVVGEKSRFGITMDNDYLNIKGEIYKQQHLRAVYERTIKDPLSEQCALMEFAWRSITFSQQDLKSTTEPMRWTFAEGRKFGHYKSFKEAVFSPLNSGSAEGEVAAGINYEDLPPVPSVNLIYMLSWDVIALEEMTGHIGAEFHGSRVGEAKEIQGINDTFAKLDFVGCTDGSFFRNGRFEAKSLGYGLVFSRPTAIFEYRCNGNLAVFSNEAFNRREQSGSSYYLGKVQIDIETGDVIAGDMLEWVTATVVNSKGKLIPQQKRRLIRLEKVV